MGWNFVMIFVGFILAGCIVSAAAYETPFEIPDDWIDPSDMENFDYGTMTNKGSKKSEEKSGGNRADDNKKPEEPSDTGQENTEPYKSQVPKEKESPPPTNLEAVPLEESGCKHPFLRRFVAVLYKKLKYIGSPPDVKDYDISLHLDTRGWSALEDFSDDCQANVPEVTRILEDMVGKVHIHIEEHNSWVRKFEDFVHISFQDFCKLGIALVIVASILTLQYISRISWSTQIARLFIIAFCISLVMTYIHELKVAEAEYRSKSVDIPKECLEKGEEGWMGGIKSFYIDMFSVKTDPCAEYHKNILIEPHIKVTPTKVIAVTLTRFAVEPMEHFGTAFSKAFKNMFAGLPITLWIPAFLLVFLVILGCLLIVSVCFGYNLSFNLPFWAGLQMGPQQAIPQNPEMDRILEDRRHEIDELRATIRELRDRPQMQALPAPTVSPGRARSILQYFGIGGGNNPPQDPPSPPPYPPQEPERRDLPYPTEEPARSNPAYPQFKPPSYPQDAPGTGLQDRDLCGFEGYDGSVLRKRNTLPRMREKNTRAGGDASLPYPCPETEPGTLSTRDAPQTSGGRRHIGFEHLLEPEDRDECESKISPGVTKPGGEPVGTGEDVIPKTVTTPVEEVALNPTEVAESQDKAFTSLPTTKKKQKKKTEMKKDEATTSSAEDVGRADNTGNLQASEEDWVDVSVDEKDPGSKSASDRFTSLELDEIFQRQERETNSSETERKTE